VIELRLKEHPKLVVTARRSYWADSDTMSNVGNAPHP
jgi:hypothetical protein